MLAKTLGAGLLALAASSVALAQEPLTLTIGVQESGTVQWEIETIKSLGLDTAHGLNLEVRPLADSRAGQIALQAGAVDVILSDFVWVAAQRNDGNLVTMVPHSLTVGGLMVPAESAIADVTGLEGKTIGVAGGPADKSWVILQAYFASKTGKTLPEIAEARYGAPPLVNELLSNGGVDAGLNFWQWNARAKAAGMHELLSVKTMLAELGVADPPPLLGWTFTEATAETKHDAVVRFLDTSFAAKEVLLTDNAAWENLKGLMGAEDNAALFEQLRDDYRAGIVSSYNPEDTDAAEQTFALLARFGGSEVVGEGQELLPGTFWPGYRK
ncbi:MAG: ABC transporter substrate-binding protein [Devosia sp.]|uniref:ABC transporter substrate-binding protein n=1 Tax=Devosia sp. TaxID=1871048 RepID=UPI003395A822